MDYQRGDLAKNRKAMTASDWIEALNRIDARDDLPLSLQGGEPTSHRDFYSIARGVTRPMDLLTNCQFNIQEFMDNVPNTTFRRNAPYASIRVSYHPEQMELNDTVQRVTRLANAGYQLGVWMVEVPEQMHVFTEAKFAFQSNGIDFRSKELLGEYKGHVYGHIKYLGAVGQATENLKTCMCRSTELIVAPDGSVHRCHSDVYNLRMGIGHILDDEFTLDRNFRFCSVYGDCSACDVKVKTNRFQEHGHTSVEIIKIGE
jgi:MoaA/NifB/PqqE/SkfB family radical SAM enzyme